MFPPQKVTQVIALISCNQIVLQNDSLIQNIAVIVLPTQLKKKLMCCSVTS